jgi:hypothetical protein
MTAFARGMAWGLLAAAIGVATALDEATAPAPAYRSGFRLVAADFHVHAFPGDGTLAPWDLRREARRRGLDAIAITNHNHTLAWRIDRRLFPDPPPPLTLPAEELTAPGYHVAAIGIREPVDWRLPLPDAIRAIHAQGGIAIAAHPVDRHGREMTDEALALLDGIELGHPVRPVDPDIVAQLERLYARAIRIKPTIAAIGSSDYHANVPANSRRTRSSMRFAPGARSPSASPATSTDIRRGPPSPAGQPMRRGIRPISAGSSPASPSPGCHSSCS